MTARVIDLAHARYERQIARYTTIRRGDRVRKRDGLREGTVFALRGSGSPDDPVEAMVQWDYGREVLPVAFLESARPASGQQAERGSA